MKKDKIMTTPTKIELPIDYEKSSFATRRQARQEYVRLQEGNCHFCLSSLDDKPPPEITNKKINWDLFPPFFLKHPIHLHHCHKTNLTIGAVHAYCNAVLWQYFGE